MNEIELSTPVSEAEARALKVGDVVYLSGTVYQMRRVAHVRACEWLEQGKELPFDLGMGAIYHAWSATERTGNGWVVRYIGGTLSMRMSRYLPALISRHGLHAVVGKAGASVSDEAKAAMCAVGCVHLGQISGCAAYRDCVADDVEVHWEDLGLEKVVALKINRLGPLVVCVDASGKEIYRPGSYVVPRFYT